FCDQGPDFALGDAESVCDLAYGVEVAGWHHLQPTPSILPYFRKHHELLPGFGEHHTRGRRFSGSRSGSYFRLIYMILRLNIVELYRPVQPCSYSPDAAINKEARACRASVSS